MIPQVAFVGPSYTLALRKADQQRSVNLMLVGMETPGKAPFVLASAPGYATFATLSGELRGGIEIGSRAFAVSGTGLYELFTDGTSILRGSLSTATGRVSMAYGLTQLVIVDGGGYVFTTTSNAFALITDPDFAGADTVAFEDNYFTFTNDRSGQQFQITSLNDALNIDALDFASAESSPDDLVGHIVVQSGILLFGTLTCELWINTGAQDFPFERSRGSGFKVGLMARASLCTIDNGCMWLGRDETGSGIVYRFVGGQPQRISKEAIEEALRTSTDLSQATAYAYQRNGLTFYALNAPGLASTWVYEVKSGQWHERCDLDADGQFKADRGTCHVFAFGKNLIGGSDGVVYRLDETVYLKGSDPLVRERTSPHTASASLKPVFFDAFNLDTTTGEAGSSIDTYVELSWFDWKSGSTWSNPVLRAIGKIGERFPKLVWRRLGRSFDRIWKVRFSGNAPFAIINAVIEDREGT